MKAVMLSIKPYYLFLIIAKTMGWKIDKEKTVEVRKSYPKDTDWNKTVILYCTKDYKSFNTIPKEYQPLMKILLGKVIAEFVCDEVVEIPSIYPSDNILIKACISSEELGEYLYKNGYVYGYGWHISDLVIYDKPKDITDFKKPCIMPEQPYCPCCEVGGEYISETEAEFYRVDGECFTEWICLNYLKHPPQSYCYVEELE